MTRIALFLISLVFSQEFPKLKVIKTIPRSGYSEGLTLYQGYLWNANQDSIKKIDPATGEVLESFKPATAHSESVIWFNGYLWNLAFNDNGIYRGKKVKGEWKFEKMGKVPDTCGWGFEYDGKHFIITGSYNDKIYYLDPKTFKLVRTLNVTWEGKPVSGIEDLGWDGKYLWSSSFMEYKGKVFAIDPKTGKIKAMFDQPKPEDCPIIDGMVAEKNTLWFTGKNCMFFYQVEKPKVK